MKRSLLLVVVCVFSITASAQTRGSVVPPFRLPQTQIRTSKHCRSVA